MYKRGVEIDGDLKIKHVKPSQHCANERRVQLDIKTRNKQTVEVWRVALSKHFQLQTQSRHSPHQPKEITNIIKTTAKGGKLNSQLIEMK